MLFNLKVYDMKGLKVFLRWLPAWLVLALAAALSGCTTVKYVPVETVKTDTTYISQVEVDSVYHRDSIFVEHKGDTVWLEKYRYVYKYLARTDTLWHERVDTVQVAYPVEIEKRLTRWQQFKLEAGGYAVVMAVLLVLAGAVYLVWKVKS